MLLHKFSAFLLSKNAFRARIGGEGRGEQQRASSPLLRPAKVQREKTSSSSGSENHCFRAVKTFFTTRLAFE
jgi:hypothetical protein